MNRGEDILGGGATVREGKDTHTETHTHTYTTCQMGEEQ